MIESLEEDLKLPQPTFTVIRSRAPLRISFCGGGTDVPPYPEKYGGCVLSCTIDKYAYVSLKPYVSHKIKVRSEEMGVEAEFDADAHANLSGKLDLAQAIFRRFRMTGIDCHMQSDAPPGSGLGSSSAMMVALIAGMAREKNIYLNAYEIADLAILIERGDLGLIGGLQDQYASAFGGFNFIEFSAAGTLVTPLRIPEDVLNELHYHLLLCYTGATRVSSNIVKEQTDNVKSADADVLDALSRMKTLTLELKNALLKHRILQFGEILDEAWALKRRLASKITNAEIEELYAAAKNSGAIGGKILGAGGGGYLLVCVPFDRRNAVRQELERHGGRVVDFQFDDSGVRSWHALPDTWKAK